MIAIVNYGLGNITAFFNIYRRLNIPCAIASAPGHLRSVDRVILPGVGAFDWAMKRLNESGMRNALDELVLSRNLPVLGVCVGMQIMARKSEEGELLGLGWIDAEVRKFGENPGVEKIQLPHMGWNDVTPSDGEGLFKDLEMDARFYFLHSYHVVPHDPSHALALTNYNGCFVSALRAGNVFGVQFHPEKSHQWGIQLLKNFAEL